MITPFSFVGSTHLHPDVNLWLSRVKTAGGSVNPPTLEAASIFCYAISSIRTKLARLNLQAGNQLVASLVPLYIGNGTTNYGNTTDVNTGFISSDFVERGFQGGLTQNTIGYFESGASATIKSLALGLNPSTLGSNNLSIGVWSNENFQAAGGADAPFNGSVVPWIYADSAGHTNGYYGSFGGADFVQGVASNSIGLTIFSRTASNATAIYLNGTLIGSTTATSSTTPSNATYTFLDGNCASVWSCGYFIGLGLTSGEVTTLYNAFLAFQKALNRSNVGVIKIECAGDSLTQGYNGAIPYSHYLPTYWNNVKIINTGVSGISLIGTLGINAQYAPDIKPAKPDSVYYTKGLLLIWGGTNDLGTVGSSATTVYAALESYWSTARSDGFKVVAFTIMQRADVAWNPTKETQRVALNTLIKSDRTKYDALIDVDGDSDFQSPSTNAYFQADFLHLTSSGNSALAYVIGNQIINPSTL